MKTISDKIRRGQMRFTAGAPMLVRQMTNMAVTYFKTVVFDKEGIDVNPGGKRWKRRKNEHKRTTKILVGEIRGGKMKRSIRGRARGREGVVSTDVSYARWHQEGTPKMPQRKFLGNSAILNRKFDKKIIRAIKKAFEG